MWGLIKKIINKKKKMDNIEEIDVEILDNELKPFVYKWTKGDLNGSVCEYKDVYRDGPAGIIWVNFSDGSRINYELLDEYMIRLEPSAVVDLDQSEIAGEITPQKNVRNSLNGQPQQRIKNENPIVSLLEKQKPNWVDVSIKLELNLPTKSLYNVLTSSFDNAEDEIIEFVVRDLDLEVVKESLRINIRQIYKNNGKEKSGIKAPTEGQE